MRFLLHMLIVSILAPSAGGAVYSFFEVDWHAAMLPEKVLGSLLGGFVLLFFVWFWTIPLGLFTGAFCYMLREAKVDNGGIWALGGGAFGLWIGWFVSLWARVPTTLLVASGTTIGLVAGFALYGVWIHGEAETGGKRRDIVV